MTGPMTVDTQDNDDRTTLLVHAYVDGELDPANAIALEQRMASEPALAAERARVEALRRVLRERLPREMEPPALRERVRRAVGLTGRRAQPTWMAMAASLALAIFASSTGTWYAMQPGAGGSVPEAVIAGHMRALMAPQPADVASSDRHTVKPWFSGRIPLAPRVVDLVQDGFPLVGGRVDVVNRTPVPSLVYGRRQHLISLTAVPNASVGITTSQTVRGYNMIAWTAEGMTYWAISDLNLEELEMFARLFRAAPS
jgi:anti-sigma factor RsiW